MISPLDDFALNFDSIPLKGAGPPDVLAGAPLDACGADAPGYTLIDDAGGRFGIDRETGVITLLHDDALATDAGAIYSVRFRCVENSGQSYEHALRLRLTGRVPQIVGQEANDALAGLVQGASFDEDFSPPAPTHAAIAAPWQSFAVFQAHAARQPLDEDGVFGALLSVALPAVQVSAALTLDVAPPAPAPAHARWII